MQHVLTDPEFGVKFDRGIVAVIGGAVTVVQYKRQPKIYQATASVVIDPTPPQVFGSQVQEVIQLGTGSYWSTQEYYNTQLQIITKWDLAKSTILANKAQGAEMLGLAPGTRSLDDVQLNAATSIFAGMLSASQARESRIVNVHVQHTDDKLRSYRLFVEIEHPRSGRSLLTHEYKRDLKWNPDERRWKVHD